MTPEWWDPLAALPEIGFKVVVGRPDGSREMLFQKRSLESIRQEFIRDPASITAVDLYPLAEESAGERLYPDGRKS